MNVYFTASTSYNGELIPLYKKILKLLKIKRLKIISGEQIVDSKKLEKDKRLSKEKIFLRQKELIEKADIVVAEASKPSLGVGGEITYALTIDKPVLALIHKDFEDKISPMLAGNPSDNLFVEYYDENNLKYVLTSFVNHIKKLKKRKGKLIVIEGGDGSGKATQARLLIDYLKSLRIPVRYYDFPQYYHSFHGKIIGRYLKGEFGGLNSVSPYLISLAYALDRASVKNEMEDFLQKGGFIVVNRYTTSSMAYQTIRFEDKKEREKFLKWLYDLEYKIHKIPKENLVIYLHVSPETAAQLVLKKGDRQYLKGKKKDIYEQSLEFQKKVEAAYLELTEKNKHWVKIECEKNGKLLSKKAIHEKIKKVVEPLIKTLI